MALGLSLPIYTLVHIAISLIGIAAGFGVLHGFLVSRDSAAWTNVFLVFTIATSVTGFFFPAEQILPSHLVGALSLVVLALAVVAANQFRRTYRWRGIYVMSTVVALYLNTFVLVVQTFVKNPVLKDFAPPQTAAPFAVTQAVLLIAFLALGVLAVIRFHPEARIVGDLRPA